LTAMSVRLLVSKRCCGVKSIICAFKSSNWCSIVAYCAVSCGHLHNVMSAWQQVQPCRARWCTTGVSVTALAGEESILSMAPPAAAALP
jgi:hypothetical protein